MSDQIQTPEAKEPKSPKFDPKATLEIRTTQALKHYSLAESNVLAIVDTPDLHRPGCKPGTIAIVVNDAQKLYYPPVN